MIATCVERHVFRGLYIVRLGRGGINQNGFVYSIDKIEGIVVYELTSPFIQHKALK